ncbi:FAD:protein FMN transferase [Derxia gummosa]|uniref:FAD:protein FMN transferase n=1 Tax=Derxia gummosa DSM 723 TaxID=1121388 RepID=A0A8B6XA49_9BURK|nr:FAD:protein FMN transferase [Derxia gummosa]
MDRADPTAEPAPPADAPPSAAVVAPPDADLAAADLRLLLPAVIDPEPLPPGAARLHLAGRAMGTTWAVDCAAPRSLDAERLRPGIEAVIARVVAQMSPWEPESDLNRWGAAPAGARLRLPADLDCVLRDAIDIARASGGAFDPTAAPLVGLWGFGPGRRHDAPSFTPPTAADLATARIGWRQLRIDADGRLGQPGGLALDLCGIAKGHAVDAVSDWLRGCGLAHHLVEIGGELRGAGMRPDAQPWWVELERPDPACPMPPARIALHGLAVATSGDARRCWSQDGRRRSHTIDPRSRRPVEHDVASVTVIHPSCRRADGWATALLVAGVDEGLALAARHGLAAIWIERLADGWRETWSAAARELLA